MNRQSRDNGRTGYTRHRTNKRQRKPKDQSGMDNPETMVTLGEAPKAKKAPSRILIIFTVNYIKYLFILC